MVSHLGVAWGRQAFSLAAVLFFAFACSNGSTAGTGIAPADSCSAVLAEPGRPLPQRDIVASDLVRLRDIGFDTGYAKDSPIGVAPDGRHIAFVITRADPSANDYCQALVVVSMADRKARVVDTGGAFIPAVSYIRGNRTPNGSPSVISPKWSPGGAWIAYVKRVDGVSRAWLVKADGTARRGMTSIATDIETVAWSPLGRRLLVTRREGIVQAQEAIGQESLSGFLYDKRIAPFVGLSPAVTGPLPLEYLAVDLDSGEISQADPAERRILGDRSGTVVPAEARKVARGEDGTLAWVIAREPNRLMSKYELWVKFPGRAPLRCTDAACIDLPRGAEELFWNGTSLLFLKRQGWGDSQTALYRWKPGGRAELILETPDILMGCTLVKVSLLCARESSSQPRRLVLIDPATGKVSVLFDPNPDFATLNLGSIRRYQWQNRFGLPGYGDLVLPPGDLAKGPLPLIVVQYTTRGFLRGGTGDEYPIFLFAAQGFAVLSIQTPPIFYQSLPDTGWRKWQEAEIENTRGWRERWSTLSSLLAGIDTIRKYVDIDPARVGITGLSDGATTVQFALVHAQNRFSAAAMSSCCMEPTSTRVDGGLAWYDLLQMAGYPTLRNEDPSFWKGISLSANAESQKTPLLMQLSEHEAILGLEAYAHLKDHGAPVEMYVFPDEYHVKSQPAHRLAIYQRNLDWFDFWLRGQARADAPAGQYERWKAMRAGTSSNSP
ncbi:hypothetical protein BH10PSE12_BH10PSE12_08530 [soil metagenome]